MRTPGLLLLLPLATACNRPPEYVGPAPAGAINCALSEALDLGYRRMEGSADDRFVRVSQRPDPAPGEGAVSVDPPPGTGRRSEDADRPSENQLIFREEAGRLRIQVVSFADGQPTTTPAPTADAHARRILATCTG